MLFQESETVELKEAFTDDIKKEIIGFANSNGGKLYVGVRDNGEIAGVENPDDVSLRISNTIRDAVKPDVTMFLRYETMEIEGKKILQIVVQRGTERPYYLAKKGMRPEGVYVRQGNSCVPATDSAIRHMIKETDGDRYEAMRSLNQTLSFSVAEKEFQMRKVEWGKQQMRSLKMMDAEGIYNNLALLLSDQCTHTIKVSVFQGENQMVFRDRREFTGSLFQQMHEAYGFIDFHNKTHATIEELFRIDSRDYPQIAVREALLNLLVHRNYSFSASALISIYDNRIEFVSVGGLVPGIEKEDIMMGVSICRNQALANVFYRLHLIEAYGTGIGKIMEAYSGLVVQPSIETTQNAFKIILPNVNTMERETATPRKNYKDEREGREEKTNEESILELVKGKGEITKKEVMELLNVSMSTASRVVQKMVQGGLLEQVGKARRTHYVLGPKA